MTVALDRSPALRQWRREVHAGVDGQHPDRPGSWQLDALHHAACLEAQALEWNPIYPPAAAELRERAAEVIIAAAAAKVERAA